MSIDAIENLIAELQDYCHAQGLPHLSADELMSEDITKDQREWLKDYCSRWNDAVEAEFSAREKSHA